MLGKTDSKLFRGCDGLDPVVPLGGNYRDTPCEISNFNDKTYADVVREGFNEQGHEGKPKIFVPTPVRDRVTRRTRLGSNRSVDEPIEEDCEAVFYQGPIRMGSFSNTYIPGGRSTTKYPRPDEHQLYGVSSRLVEMVREEERKFSQEYKNIDISHIDKLKQHFYAMCRKEVFDLHNPVKIFGFMMWMKNDERGFEGILFRARHLFQAQGWYDRRHSYSQVFKLAIDGILDGFGVPNAHVMVKRNCYKGSVQRMNTLSQPLIRVILKILAKECKVLDEWTWDHVEGQGFAETVGDGMMSFIESLQRFGVRVKEAGSDWLLDRKVSMVLSQCPDFMKDLFDAVSSLKRMVVKLFQRLKDQGVAMLQKIDIPSVATIANLNKALLVVEMILIAYILMSIPKEAIVSVSIASFLMLYFSVYYSDIQFPVGMLSKVKEAVSSVKNWARASMLTVQLKDSVVVIHPPEVIVNHVVRDEGIEGVVSVVEEKEYGCSIEMKSEKFTPVVIAAKFRDFCRGIFTDKHFDESLIHNRKKKIAKDEPVAEEMKCIDKSEAQGAVDDIVEFFRNIIAYCLNLRNVKDLSQTFNSLHTTVKKLAESRSIVDYFKTFVNWLTEKVFGMSVFDMDKSNDLLKEMSAIDLELINEVAPQCFDKIGVVQKIERYIALGHELSPFLVKEHSSFVHFQRMMRKAEAFSLELCRFRNKGKTRPEPPFVMFNGVAGSGKTKMSEFLFAGCYNILKKPEDIPYATGTHVYPRRCNQEYWEQYHNQFGTCYQDIFQSQDPDDRKQEALEIIHNVSSELSPLNMAFGLKGHVFFNSRMLVGTTNVLPCDMNNIRIDKAAFMRRIFGHWKILTKIEWDMDLTADIVNNVELELLACDHAWLAKRMRWDGEQKIKVKFRELVLLVVEYIKFSESRNDNVASVLETYSAQGILSWAHRQVFKRVKASGESYRHVRNTVEFADLFADVNRTMIETIVKTDHTDYHVAWNVNVPLLVESIIRDSFFLECVEEILSFSPRSRAPIVTMVGTCMEVLVASQEEVSDVLKGFSKSPVYFYAYCKAMHCLALGTPYVPVRTEGSLDYKVRLVKRPVRYTWRAVFLNHPVLSIVGMLLAPLTVLFVGGLVTSLLGYKIRKEYRDGGEGHSLTKRDDSYYKRVRQQLSALPIKEKLEQKVHDVSSAQGVSTAMRCVTERSVNNIHSAVFIKNGIVSGSEILFIKARVAITVKHIFMDSATKVSAPDTIIIGDMVETRRFKMVFHPTEDKTIIYFQDPSIPFAKDISHHIYEGDAHDFPAALRLEKRISGGQCIITEVVGGHTYPINMPCDLEHNFLVCTSSNVWACDGAGGEPGICGTPYFVLTSKGPRLFAYHVGLNRHLASSRLIRIYRSDIDESLVSGKDDWCEAQCNFGKFKIDNVDCSYFPGTIPCGTLDRKAHVPTKTKIVRTVVQDLVDLPVTKAPAVLNKVLRDGVLVSPLEKAITCYERRVVRKVPDRLPNPQRVAERLFPRKFRKPYVKLTLEQAIFGDPEVGVSSIDHSTSAGFPYVLEGLTKSLLYDVGTRTVGPRLRRDVEARDTALVNKQIVPLIVIDTLKDETRTIDRVKACKTRLFCAGSVDHLVWARQYFGVFLAELEKLNVQSFCSIGVNPYSNQWALLYEKVSFGKVTMGDYEKYDMSLQAWLARLVYEVTIIAMGIEKKPIYKMDRRAVWAVIYSMSHSIHLLQGFLYMINGGNSSGNLLTSYYNSVSNSIMHEIVFLYCMPIYLQDMFNDMVKENYYGDDSLNGVHSDIKDIYNMHTLRDLLYRYCGTVYTSALKGDISQPYLDPDCGELTYLSRRVYAPLGVAFATLPMDTIVSSTQWMFKGDLSSREWTIAVLDTAFYEFWLYGESKFDEMVEKYVKVFEYYKIAIPLKDTYFYRFQRGYAG